jgi:3D (Asp-Asp-Asp) domain-containing protein
MKLESSIQRKVDAAFVLAALILLWGPGIKLSWGERQLSTAAIPPPIEDISRPENPCEDPLPPLGNPALQAQEGGGLSLLVTVTGYSSSLSETDDSPGITATSAEAGPGVIALSQDLLAEFTPGAPFRFHDRVEIAGLGVFQVEDTMNPRWAMRADVWFPSRDDALAWGRRTRKLLLLSDTPRHLLLLPTTEEVAATFGRAHFL